MMIDSEPVRHLISMAVFAFVTSITPGPVNIVLAMSGAQHGIRKSQPYVMGATVSFTALLAFMGMGLGALIGRYPNMIDYIKICGVAYMLYLAYRIIASGTNSSIKAEYLRKPPGILDGVLTQLLNPKAWAVSLSASAIYVAGNESPILVLVTFGILFFFICYASLWTWAALGSKIAQTSAIQSSVLHWVLGISLILSIALIFT